MTNPISMHIHGLPCFSVVGLSCSLAMSALWTRCYDHGLLWSKPGKRVLMVKHWIGLSWRLQRSLT